MGASHSINTTETSRSGSTLFVHEKRQLGKYQILAELGRGGAASVSLAVTRGKGGVRKLVVLKALLPELAEEPEAVTAFIDEAKLAAQLNHPNVVQTYEVGTESGRHVIVMEYLDGQSLSRIIRTAHKAQKFFPLQIHLRVLVEMLEGLHYAHEMKAYDGSQMRLVHRDVSPQNVIVTYDGQVKILDFGIAKAAATSTHTAAGIMKGKIAYMAPEQMAGTIVDRRADIYSAGCMLWAAATGQKLWQDVPDVQIVRAVVAGRIPSPKSVNLDCPDELERIIMRALHPDPEQRYPTALEFLSDLEQFTERLGKSIKQRDIGRYVSQLFAESRAEFNETLERELAALLATDQSYKRVSLSDIHDGNSAAPPPHGVESPSLSGVQTSRPRSHQRRRVVVAAVVGAVCLGGIALMGLKSRSSNASAPALSSPPASQALGVSSALARTPASASALTVATIKFDVAPATARIVLDGKALEAGTTSVTLPIGAALHEMTVEADGYVRENRSFKVEKSTSFAIHLSAKAEAAKARGGIAIRPRGGATHGNPVDVATPSATPVPAPPAKPAAASCDNPFFVDAQGIKRVRPNCL